MPPRKRGAVRIPCGARTAGSTIAKPVNPKGLAGLSFGSELRGAAVPPPRRMRSLALFSFSFFDFSLSFLDTGKCTLIGLRHIAQSPVCPRIMPSLPAVAPPTEGVRHRGDKYKHIIEMNKRKIHRRSGEFLLFFCQRY